MDISASQFSSDRHAETVETQIRIAVFDSNSFEKIEPSFCGTLWADIGLRYSLIKHCGEQRNELFMEPGYVCFAALGPKHYLSAFDINVPYRVEISFRKPTALIPSNLKAIGQETSQRLWLLGHALTNQLNIRGRQRGFDFAGDALNPKLTAWIGGSITTKDRFLHYQAKGLDFEQGGVMARSVLASPQIVELAPFDVGMAILPSEQPGCENPLIFKEHFYGTPSGKVPSFALEIVAVAFVEEHWNPAIPCLRTEHAPTPPLNQSPLGDKLSGAPCIFTNPDSEASRFPAKLSMGSAEFNPPELGVFSTIKGSHVYPNVTGDKI